MHFWIPGHVWVLAAQASDVQSHQVWRALAELACWALPELQGTDSNRHKLTICWGSLSFIICKMRINTVPSTQVGVGCL